MLSLAYPLFEQKRKNKQQTFIYSFFLSLCFLSLALKCLTFFSQLDIFYGFAAAAGRSTQLHFQLHCSQLQHYCTHLSTTIIIKITQCDAFIAVYLFRFVTIDCMTSSITYIYGHQSDVYKLFYVILLFIFILWLCKHLLSEFDGFSPFLAKIDWFESDGVFHFFAKAIIWWTSSSLLVGTSMSVY